MKTDKILKVIQYSYYKVKSTPYFRLSGAIFLQTTLGRLSHVLNLT